MDKYKTNLAKAFGSALREARNKSGLSQEDLALESGIDRTFVSMLERGIRQPALSSIFLLSVALETTPAALVNRASQLLTDLAAKAKR